MGNRLTNGDTGNQGGTSIGFALPARQVKAALLSFRVSSLKQSLKWKKVCTVHRKGGKSLSAKAHPRLSSGTPAGVQPAFAQGSYKQTHPVLSKELSKQRDLQYCRGLCFSAAEKTRRARNVAITAPERLALPQPAAVLMGRVPPGMGAVEITMCLSQISNPGCS